MTMERPLLRAAARLSLALGVLFTATVSPAAGQLTGTLRGQVRSEVEAAPIPGAVVEVLGLAGHAVVAGRSGRYELRDVPAGRRVVRVRHIGHAPLEIEVVVPAGREMLIDLSLRLAPIVLAPVEVAAGRDAVGIDTLEASPAELGLAGARALGSSPGLSELGLAEAIHRVPGQEPPDPSSVLYVRGAAADLKLVYLDGAPVYAPFPLGGLIDAFAPGTLGSAEVFLGGAPARYDGGLSYVMDLRTRGVRTDAFRTSGSLDLVSARAAVETPLAPGVSVLASGRAVHGAGTMDPLPYGYTEGLLRADVSLPAGAALHITGFGNEESVLLEQDPVGDGRVEWGNTAAAVRLTLPMDAGGAEVTASLGSFVAGLPLSGSGADRIDAGVRRARLAADVSRRVQDVTLRYGLSLDRLTHSYRATLRDGARTSAEAAGGAVGAYVDGSWRPTGRLSLRGGLRADYFGYGEETALAPRLSLTYMATDDAALTVAGGRYHQYVRAPDAAVLFPHSEESGGGVPDPLSVGASTHLAVSLDQQLAEGLGLGLAGFFKSFEGVALAGSNHASASGVDIWLSRSSDGISGWAAYSLAWIWSGDGGGGGVSDRFAGRHLLSAGLGAPISRRMRLDASVSYGSGLPYAAIPLMTTAAGGDITPAPSSAPKRVSLQSAGDAAPLLPAPDRPYLRLDISASHAWSGRVGGREVQLASYLKLLNTLGDRDALFYRYDADQELRALAAIPTVPVLGVEWRF